jgi:hypothetical protein
MFTDKQEIALRPGDNLVSQLLEQVEQSRNVIDAAYIERGACNSFCVRRAGNVIC